MTFFSVRTKSINSGREPRKTSVMVVIGLLQLGSVLRHSAQHKRHFPQCCELSCSSFTTLINKSIICVYGNVVFVCGFLIEFNKHYCTFMESPIFAQDWELLVLCLQKKECYQKQEYLESRFWIYFLKNDCPYLKLNVILKLLANNEQL